MHRCASMAALAAQQPKPIKALFAEAEALLRKVEDGADADDASTCVSLLDDAWAAAAALDLFPAGCTGDDVATADLRYALIPDLRARARRSGMSAYLKSAVATSSPVHPAGKRSSAAAAAQASSNRLTHVDASSASAPSSTLRRSASASAKRALMGLGCCAARAAMLAQRCKDCAQRRWRI